jgi:N-acetyl sugar amidotransferase
MDTSIHDIQFDSRGNCNYCSEFLAAAHLVLSRDRSQRNKELSAFVAEIKRAGEGKRYDCIVGVSGGVDSSWVLVQAVRLGLRPLAVHMDNGWNTELAQNNIAKLVQKLGVDLFTHVIDWDEYRDLMQAFFDSDVVDIELLYDNAMLGVNYREARRWGVRYILSGSNLATEGMRMPVDWNWFKYDGRNIKGISSRFSGRSIKSFPLFGTLSFVGYKYILGIQWTSILDLLPYNKAEVLETLESEYEYKRYPYKHYESVFTRFYQGHILLEKFGIDKRIVHFSNLVLTGQISRADAIDLLKRSPYPSATDRDQDINFFLKKMKWSHTEFIAYLKRPRVAHDFYPSERSLYIFLRKIYSRLSALRGYSTSSESGNG